ncbi:MAG TPA: aldehyde dehydrogenase family protein [Cytophagales bacterium]|nr:aldehyde dehydrogenase family protein [Cytophagales bacterium]
MFQSINPYTKESLFTREFDSDTAIVQQLNNATEAYILWKDTTFSTRASTIYAIAKDLIENKEEYARTISLEMGKHLRESLTEIEKCASACDYFASNSQRLLMDYEDYLSKDLYRISISPSGAVFGIMPWNFPFWQVFRYVIPNLMLGNICLLKHAPNVGLSALLIEKILNKHLPECVFQHIWADISQIELIVSHPIVSGTTLTGSEKAGASLASISGKHLKKTVLELGGSDPFIVEKTCNLAHTVDKAIQGRLQNNGQTCIAAKRFIIDQEILEDFKRTLLDELSKISVGDPFDPSNSYGTLAREDLTQNLLNQIEKALKQGASPLNTWKCHNNSLNPIVLEVDNSRNIAFKEELFGPVFVLKSFKSVNEAINLANDTHYGLAASIWSHDNGFIDNVLRNTVAGSIFVNELPKSDVTVPFGGTKRSGYGKELSVLGLTEFSNIKTTINHRLFI